MSEWDNLEDNVSSFEWVSIVHGCVCSSCHIIMVGFIQGQSQSSSHLFNKPGQWLTGFDRLVKGNWVALVYCHANVGCCALWSVCTLAGVFPRLWAAVGALAAAAGCGVVGAADGGEGLCTALVEGTGGVTGATSTVVCTSDLMAFRWCSQMLSHAYLYCPLSMA